MGQLESHLRNDCWILYDSFRKLRHYEKNSIPSAVHKV